MMMILLIVIFLGIDIVSKLLISKIFKVNESIVIIKDFFNITYVRNTGAAWSILSGFRIGLVIVSLVIIGFIVYYVYKNKISSMMEKIGYSMILGGALGNLLDRIFYGYVIDFLDFKIFGYNYPVFNLADTFIVIGVFMLILFGRNGEETEVSCR